MAQSRLTIVPVSLSQANGFITRYHRHHRPVVGHRFSIGVIDGGDLLRGVATVGRPVARGLDDGNAVEVTRVCTDGCQNACSSLYGDKHRIAKELGFATIYTYTLESESGVSLRATGWSCDGPAGGGSWSVPSRPRIDKAPLERKVRYSYNCNPRRNWRIPETTVETIQHGLFDEASA